MRRGQAKDPFLPSDMRSRFDDFEAQVSRDQVPYCDERGTGSAAHLHPREHDIQLIHPKLYTVWVTGETRLSIDLWRLIYGRTR